MKGLIVWLTGRPGAGKSTLAAAAADELRSRGHDVVWLDSDEVRRTRVPELGFDEKDRDMFYQRLGDLALAAAEQHAIVLVSATAPYVRYRDAVRDRAGDFIEVFVTAPEATLAARDPKGLYAKAREGSVTELPGVGRPYEPPPRPELVCDTSTATVDGGADAIVSGIASRLQRSTGP